MPLVFDDILLDKYYSAVASGGPEHATAVIRSAPGGVIAHRAETREDFQSKYEIQYASLDKERQQDLRKFAILRKGQARGFLFLPPDDNTLVNERLGILDAPSGEVVRMGSTTAGITDYYLVKHYADVATSYTRRIVKPSPYETITLELRVVADDTLRGSAVTISSADCLNIDGSIKETVAKTLTATSSFPLTFYPNAGKIIFESAPNPSGGPFYLRISCQYHLPAVFTDDWQNFGVDVITSSKFQVGIRELLPVELGIV